MKAANDGRGALVSGWFAVRCNPQRQFIAARKLELAGVTVFMPTHVKWGSRRGTLGRCRVVRPLVCGYLFVLIDLADQRLVLDQEDVGGFLGYSDGQGVTRPLPLPVSIIFEMQVDVELGVFDETRFAKPVYRPKKGDRARVTSGAWQGFFAKVIATPKADRVHVMVEGPYGRGVTLPTNQLRAAG